MRPERFKTDIDWLMDPCQTPEELDNFIQHFFSITLPWHWVDPLSTSSPLACLWSVYEVLLTGNGNHRHVMAVARNGAKCLKNGTEIATPGGPVEIQNLKPGDLVYDEYGNPIRVLELHNQGIQECVNLVHQNKIYATCTANHRWQGYDLRRKNVWKIVTPEKMSSAVKIRRVEISSPIGGKAVKNAYAIGAMLGDGCRGNSSMTISSGDESVPKKIAALLETTYKKGHADNFDWRILVPDNVGRNARSAKGHKYWSWSEYYDRWCKNKYAHEKTCDINELKTWDRESLLEFLAGLIDTDGHVGVAKKYNKNQINLELGMQAKDVIYAAKWIIFALWQVDCDVTIYDRKHYKNGPLYRIRLSHNYHNKRILRELSPHLVVDRKKYKAEYDSMPNHNFNPSGMGFKVEPAGMHQTWDISVESETNLYCLQNGLVTHNTLVSTILQILSMLHFRRSGNHISATLDQSSAMITYFDQLVNKIELLAPYKSTDNVKQKLFVGLPPNSYTTNNYAKLKVVTATKRGANSSRANLITYDEVDLTPPQILSEAAFIADPTSNPRRDPVFVYLSSRKTNTGPVQALIDEAISPDADDISLHKWSAVDFMERCPEEIHKPELGVSKAYINTENLSVKWSEQEFFSSVPEASRSQYNELAIYEGCKTCPAFIACQGMSARQQGTSPMLRTRKFVGGVLKAVKDTAAIISQSLNWKPETTGLVFKTFSHHTHVKAPIEFFEWALGYRYNPLNYTEEEWDRIYEEGDIVELMSITPTKEACYYAMVDNGWTVTFGIDWGFNPDPAFVVVCAWHKKTGRLAVLHMDFELDHSNHVWAKYVCETVVPRFTPSFVAPDMADPASPTYFAKYRVRSLDSKPSRIETGVSFIRGLLWNPVTAMSNFAIFDDSQGENKNKEMSESMSHWSHAKDALGRFKMDKFADGEYTHALDSLRYATAPFVSNIAITAAMGQNVNLAHAVPLAARGDTAAVQALREKNSMMNQFSDFMNREHGVQNVLQKPADILAGNRPDGTPNKQSRSGIKFKF